MSRPCFPSIITGMSAVGVSAAFCSSISVELLRLCCLINLQVCRSICADMERFLVLTVGACLYSVALNNT